MGLGRVDQPGRTLEPLERLGILVAHQAVLVGLRHGGTRGEQQHRESEDE